MNEMQAAIEAFLAQHERNFHPSPEELTAFRNALTREVEAGLQRGQTPPRTIIEGEGLRIRTACLADEPFMSAVEMEEDNRQWVGHWPLAWRVARMGDPDFLQCIIERTDGTPLGLLIFTDMTRTSEKLQLKRIALLDKGRGIGRTVLQLVQRWAFTDVGTPLLYLGTKADNHRAQHVYLATGFQPDTPLPATHFSMTRDAYLAAHEGL